MKLQIESKAPLVTADLNNAVQAVTNTYLQKLKVDAPEAYAQLQLEQDSQSLILLQVQVDLGFKVEGTDEIQMLTTDVRGKDLPELLTVTATINEDGSLDFGSVKDNDTQSNFTDVEALIATGLPKEFKAIESKYYSDQLDEVYSMEVSDFEIVIYLSVESDDIAIVQYSTDNKLVQELEVSLSDSRTVDDLIAHYTQLIN